MKVLLAAGAGVNAADGAGFNALHHAASKGSLQCVRYLLSAGADVNVSVKLNWLSALSAAAEHGHADVAQLLLSAGAHVDVYTLHRAAQMGHIDVLVLLLDAGADVNAYHAANTALHVAVRGGNNNVSKVLKVLLAAGAHANAPDVDGRTPLHLAVHCCAQNVSVVLSAGADVNAVDNRGDTALHIAAQNRFPDVVKVLLVFGAHVDAVNRYKCTPLISAAASLLWDSCAKVTQLLIAAGADVNAVEEKAVHCFV